MLKHLIINFVLLISVAPVLAGTNCDNLLGANALKGPKTTPFEFFVSDTEALYLEIISDIAQFESVSPEKHPYFFESFLNKKSELLNNIIQIVRRFKSNSHFEAQSKIKLTQIYNMLFSLGIDPELYGLNSNSSNQAQLKVERKQKKKELKKGIAPTPSENMGFIGFLEPKDLSGENNSKKTKGLGYIGFLPQPPKEEQLPHRQIGQIAIEYDQETNFLKITDSQNNIEYIVARTDLARAQVKISGKQMTLTFNSKSKSWFVSFENLANPSGQIGFHSPSDLN